MKMMHWEQLQEELDRQVPKIGEEIGIQVVIHATPLSHIYERYIRVDTHHKLARLSVQLDTFFFELLPYEHWSTYIRGKLLELYYTMSEREKQ